MLSSKQSQVISVLRSLFLTIFERVEKTTFVTQRSALGGNDFVDWSSLNRVFNPFASNFNAFLPSSFSIESSAGMSVKVDIWPANISGMTPPFVFQTSSEGIPTNFDRGDYILFTGFIPGKFPALGNSNPITITFDRPVKAAGTQLAVDDLANFNISLAAFDDKGNSLGLFSVAGTASKTLDRSPQFVGVKSETPKIKKLVYSYSNFTTEACNSSSSQRAFGINYLSIDNASIAYSSRIFSLLNAGLAGMRAKFLNKDRLNKE